MRGFSRPQQVIALCLAVFIALVWFFFHRDPRSNESESHVRLTIVEAEGEVRLPGVYFFEKPPPLDDIVAAAGGLKSTAALDRSTAPRVFETGQCLVFSDSGRGTIEILVNAMTADKSIPLGAPVDLNRASVGDLELLPYVSPALAAQIVETRKRRGPFDSVDDLLKVKGIGPATMEKLKPYVEARP